MHTHPSAHTPTGWATRLPFFYGWVVVAVAFVTMGIGLNTRTAFSLLFPPILTEFGWERGVTAGAFSFGFIVSSLYAPFIGMLMDRWGPRYVIPFGVILVSAGLISATWITQPWHLYLTLGALVVGGSIFLSYVGHSLFLPNWFIRRRGLAIGIAFSGVGIGSITIFPWIQRLIDGTGWRQACWSMAVMLLIILLPLNFFFQRQRPEDIGLAPDGDPDPTAPGVSQAVADNVVDPAWVAIDWTLRRALKTARFWWIFIGFLTGLFAWYAVQVHQTKYLQEIGFQVDLAAKALGLVGLTGIVGQIALGHLSDRLGREWAWTLGGLGYAACYAFLLLMGQTPTPLLMYLMVASQGVLGYGLASVFGAIPAEVFQGKHYGVIFGTLSLGAGSGAALGPWVSGALYDHLGNYTLAFSIALLCSLVSIGAIWLAAPRKVRAVAGQIPRLHARRAQHAAATPSDMSPSRPQTREHPTSIDQARGRFEHAAFTHFLGAEIIALAPAYAVLRLPFKTENANSGGGPLHGGATASLINMAGTLAAWTGVDLLTTRFLGCVDLSVQYLAPAMNEDITAEAALLRRGRDIFFLDVTVRGGSEQLIGKGSMIYRAPTYGGQPMRMYSQAMMLSPPEVLSPPTATQDGEDFTYKLRMTTEHSHFGRVRMHMPYATTHRDAHGHLHEGALATLLDTAGTQAAWSMVQRQGARGATIGMQVSYTGLSREDVVAEARIQQRSEELFFALVQIHTVTSRQLVAMGNVSYRLLETR